MPRPPAREPTAGELELLEILWDIGPATLGQVCEALRESRPVADTTVATMLKVMHGKGLVSRRKAARGSLWSARKGRDETASTLVGRLLDRLFDGSARRLVAHLIEDGRLSPRDRAELQRLLEDHSRPD